MIRVRVRVRVRVRARELEALGFLQLTLALGEEISWAGGFGEVR